MTDFRHPITYDGNLIAFLRCTLQRFINRKNRAQRAENRQINEIKKLHDEDKEWGSDMAEAERASRSSVNRTLLPYWKI